MTELKHALRSGEVSVPGSRQFKDFDDYLLNTDTITRHRTANQLGIANNP